jgi:hypothetical protein
MNPNDYFNDVKLVMVSLFLLATAALVMRMHP